MQVFAKAVASEALKTSPAAGTATALAFGISLPQMVQVLAAGYIILQAGYLVWKWRRDARRHRWERDEVKGLEEKSDEDDSR